MADSSVPILTGAVFQVAIRDSGFHEWRSTIIDRLKKREAIVYFCMRVR
jgi:hypothetical protein